VHDEECCVNIPEKLCIVKGISLIFNDLSPIFVVTIPVMKSNALRTGILILSIESF